MNVVPMAGNLEVLGFLSMVGLAITLSKEALIGVALAAQLMLLGVLLETPTLHAQTTIFLGVLVTFFFIISLL